MHHVSAKYVCLFIVNVFMRFLWKVYFLMKFQYSFIFMRFLRKVYYCCLIVFLNLIVFIFNNYFHSLLSALYVYTFSTLTKYLWWPYQLVKIILSCIHGKNHSESTIVTPQVFFFPFWYNPYDLFPDMYWTIRMIYWKE